MRETGHPVDVAVGQNIRLIRKPGGLTQENLAAGLGVSFQQLQKYEKAANRVSCSMLIRICEQLGAHPMDILPPVNGVAHPLTDMPWYRDAQIVHLAQPRLLPELRRLSRAQLHTLLLAARVFA